MPGQSVGSWEEDDLLHHPLDRLLEERPQEEDDEEARERKPLLSPDEYEDEDEDEEGVDEAQQHNHDSFYTLGSSSLQEPSASTYDEENPDAAAFDKLSPRPVGPKTGFVKALLDSAIPQDLRDNTVGIIKGDYVVEKKTLLHHAATSDTYDLFSRRRRGPGARRPASIFTKSSDEQPSHT